MSTEIIILTIILGAIVSWVPRVFPFVLVKFRGLPTIVVRFLEYLPITIIFALSLSSMFETTPGQLPAIKWLEFIVLFPTLFVAVRYKDLLWTVLVGIVSMALLRLIF